MADETLLTADNGTDGGSAAASNTAGTGAPANDASTDATTQANTETQQQNDQSADKAAGDDAGKQQDGQPQTYEYQLPEGYQLTDESKGSFEGWAAKHGLSNEALQEAVEMHVAALKQSQDSLMEAITAQQEQWLTTTKADKEIGGAKLKEVGAVCSEVIAKLGSDALKNALNETGIGNHPEVIRFVYRIGQELGIKEGAIVTNGSGSAVQKSAAETLFDKSLGQQ